MNVQLIAVIEISNADQGMELPEHGPFWEYSEDWENYNRLCNAKAGFSDELKPYCSGSFLYRIDEIPDTDLLRAVRKEMKDAEESEEDFLVAFSGGYVLRTDNRDLYFPQCCGDLADIKEWEYLIEGETEFFFAGHPSPQVTENGERITFDFTSSATDENFSPPVPVESIEIKRSDLEAAIINVKKELQIFAKRLDAINRIADLNIKNIDKQLIYGEVE